MSSRIPHTILALMIPLAGCQAPEPDTFSAEERAAVADTVDMALRNWFQAFLDRDADLYVGMFAEDFILAGDQGYLVTEAAEYIQRTRETVAGGRFERITGEILVDDVEILGPEAAVAVWHVDMEFVLADGASLRHLGLSTGVLARREGGWKLIRQHESGIPPAP